MRPVFCGNFEYETRQGDLDRLFSKYGRVDRVDIKSGKLLRRTELPSGPMAEKFFLPACSSAPFSNGFAFVYFEDECDAEDAIRYLDGTPFGYSKRRLSVEWARGERGSQHRDGSKSLANQRPTKTLFVINFDPIRTRTIDIEKHFEPYGTILHVRIRRNFAFVQFETQEEATKALECTHMSKIMDRMVSVEYALKDDGERDSPRRGGYGRRGGSPFGRARSPDYGRDCRGRPSPDYGLPRRGRPSPDYGRNRSPVYDRYGGPSYSRDRSPDYVRYRSRSPIRRSRT